MTPRERIMEIVSDKCKNFTTTTDSKEQSRYESLCTAGAIGYKVAIDDVIESITEVISKSSGLPVEEYRKVIEVAENIVTQIKQKIDI